MLLSRQKATSLIPFWVISLCIFLELFVGMVQNPAHSVRSLRKNWSLLGKFASLALFLWCMYFYVSCVSLHTFFHPLVIVVSAPAHCCSSALVVRTHKMRHHPNICLLLQSIRISGFASFSSRFREKAHQTRLPVPHRRAQSLPTSWTILCSLPAAHRQFSRKAQPRGEMVRLECDRDR